MAKAGIERHFENDIGRLVGRVSRGVKRIKQSAAGAGGVDEEVLRRISGRGREGREPPSAECGLRRFHGKRHGNFVLGKTLYRAETILPRPSPADHVLRVLYQRRNFTAVHNSLLVFCHQAPHLAGRQAQAIVKRHLRERLALAEHITVALPVVGGRPGAQEIRFVIPADLGAGQFSFYQQAHAAVPSREIQLRNFTEGVPRIGNARQRRVDVGAGRAAAEDSRRIQEASGRDIDALVLDRTRPFFRGFLRLGLFFGHRRLEHLIAGLQVADRGIQRRCRGFDFRRRIDGLAGLGAGFGRAGVGGGSGLTGPVDLPVALGKLFLQQLKLFLLGLQSLPELFDLGRNGRVGFLGFLRRFGLGRLRRLGRFRVGVFR